MAAACSGRYLNFKIVVLLISSKPPLPANFSGGEFNILAGDNFVGKAISRMQHFVLIEPVSPKAALPGIYE